MLQQPTGSDSDKIIMLINSSQLVYFLESSPEEIAYSVSTEPELRPG